MGFSFFFIGIYLVRSLMGGWIAGGWRVAEGDGMNVKYNKLFIYVENNKTS